MNNIPYQKAPCKNCPFKKNEGIKFLGKERAKEIIKNNSEEGFVCHKTTNSDIRSRRQCAGALILAKKENKPQPFLDLYESMFGEMELRGKDLIVDSSDEFIKNQERQV